MSPLRWLYVAIGCLAVALGVVGIFLPVLPTTPFLLVAAWAFSKGSERFHRWLVKHKVLGPPIQKWQEHGAIGRRPKLLATSFMLASGIYVVGFRPVATELKVVIVVSFAAVLTFIWTRPER